MSHSPSSADSPPPDLTGRTLGEFQLLRKLGQGGMGQVYLARQLSLKRDVALKILRDDHAANPTALKRFQAEAEAVARISHPNIVQVYAVGDCDGLKYMALEYVSGRNLREYLERKGPPDLPVALTILRQVAAALQRASELGLVHRDIKPENILVTRKAEVKVTDFGLSRYFAGDTQPLSLTQSGMTLGTPLYMSPEQVQGKPVDHRSDLYSFGVTAYHLLAGFPPFRGATAFEVAAQHVQREPDPLTQLRPDLPADLSAVVHKLMAKVPEERYPSAKDVIRELNRIQKGLTLGSSTSSISTATRKLPAPPLNMSISGLGVSAVVTPIPDSSSLIRWTWRAFGMLALLLAAGGGWWVASRMRSEPETVSEVPVTGLPQIRPPTPLESTRETALKAQMKSAPPNDRKFVEAGMQLGLLYVSERRWMDAEKVFGDLNVAAPKPKDHPLPVPSEVLSRLGQAIVLAHQDKPAESIQMFEKAIGLLGNRTVQRAPMEKLCFSYPEFGHAIAEAVSRNADNMPNEKLPPVVEWLRNPSSVLRGQR